MKTVQLSVLLLLLSTAAASEDATSAAEQTSDVSEMPERAVFEVCLPPWRLAHQTKSSRWLAL
jgi:hypothetical protein